MIDQLQKLQQANQLLTQVINKVRQFPYINQSQVSSFQEPYLDKLMFPITPKTNPDEITSVKTIIPLSISKIPKKWYQFLIKTKAFKSLPSIQKRRISLLQFVNPVKKKTQKSAKKTYQDQQQLPQMLQNVLTVIQTSPSYQNKIRLSIEDKILQTRKQGFTGQRRLIFLNSYSIYIQTINLLFKSVQLASSITNVFWAFIYNSFQPNNQWMEQFQLGFDRMIIILNTIFVFCIIGAFFNVKTQTYSKKNEFYTQTMSLFSAGVFKWKQGNLYLQTDLQNAISQLAQWSNVPHQILYPIVANLLTGQPISQTITNIHYGVFLNVRKFLQKQILQIFQTEQFKSKLLKGPLKFLQFYTKFLLRFLIKDRYSSNIQVLLKQLLEFIEQNNSAEFRNYIETGRVNYAPRIKFPQNFFGIGSQDLILAKKLKQQQQNQKKALQAQLSANAARSKLQSQIQFLKQKLNSNTTKKLSLTKPINIHRVGPPKPVIIQLPQIQKTQKLIKQDVDDVKPYEEQQIVQQPTQIPTNI